jgi:lipopolysaccharide biosynthesis glycosyltransferase
MKDKVCLVSMVDDNFMMCFIAFIKSLIWSNPKLKRRFILFDVGLSEENKKICLDYYPTIEFRDPLKENYSKVNFEKTVDCLKNTFYKLDAFTLFDMEKVVFLDLDMLILNDISALFNIEQKYGLAGIKAYSKGNDRLRNDINTGVFVINKKFLNRRIYDSLIECAITGHSMPDQRVINKTLHNQILFLDKRYNCEKRMYFSNRYLGKLMRDCSVLHFVSQKPYEKNKTSINQGYEKLERVWWHFYNTPLEKLKKEPKMPLIEMIQKYK